MKLNAAQKRIEKNIILFIEVWAALGQFQTFRKRFVLEAVLVKNKTPIIYTYLRVIVVVVLVLMMRL